MIFIYPFLFIFCGAFIPQLDRRWQKWVLVLAMMFLVVSVLRYWRNYYPYSNELIGDKKMAYRYIGASNLEFKQGKYFAEAYLLKHPEVSMAPVSPRPGVYLINTADYLDIWNRHQYDRLSKYKPSGEVAYSWLLISVSKADLENHHPETE